MTFPQGEQGRSPNPYVRVLRRHLAELGFEPLTDVNFSVRDLVRERNRAGYIHVHFPELFYRYKRGPRLVRLAAGWAKVALLLPRLAAARALGYRIAWTVHQVYPHESISRRLERIAAQAVARAAHVLIAHDESTATRVRNELGEVGGKLALIPHASFAQIYRTGSERPRDVVREELGISPEAFTFLCFGILRAYKDVDLVVEAFRSASLPHSSLVIAGPAKHQDVLAFVEAAARADPRIRVIGGVAEDRVCELFSACDAAVVARGDGGTSGALILALSLGLPVLASDRPAYAELVEGCEAGWLFEPRNLTSLRQALEEAALDRNVAREKGAAAATCNQIPSWDDVARRIAELLDPA